MARPPWYSKIAQTQLRHFLLRARAALAEPFAQLDLSQHPWDEEALALIGRQVSKVISLFIQLEAFANQSKKQTLVKPDVLLCYEFSGKHSEWRNFDKADLRSKLSFKGPVNGNNTPSFELIIHHTQQNIPPVCWEFLKFEMEKQVNLVLPTLANPRTDWQYRAAQESATKFWDLRIRLTSFLYRFLSFYRNNNHMMPDPFTVFFLKPRTMGEKDEHVRSGFFGYEYAFDMGQSNHLRDVLSEPNEFIENPPRLRFPDGICSRVFLEGRTSEPHDVAEIQKSYQSEELGGKVKEFEEEILQNAILLEIPVYTVGIISVPTDGPELIITIRVPMGEVPLKWADAFPGWAQSLSNESDKENTIFVDIIKTTNDKTFLDGELHIVSETCQRLIRLYLQPVSMMAKSSIIANSQVMQRLLEKSTTVAKTDFNILLYGASGTGKSTIAEEIHRQSGRPAELFKRISAATLSREMALSQLFGHEAGAFTGATVSRDGLLIKLNGGTLFLDDFDALDLHVQARLLSYLDTYEFAKLGGEEKVASSSRVRFICATNEPIKTLLEQGKIRRDFLHRINGFNIEIPSLSRRKEDIRDLVDHFVNKGHEGIGLAAPPTIQEEYYQEVERYCWNSGELRQLRHFICRSMVYASEGLLTDLIFKRVAMELADWEKVGENPPPDEVECESNEQ